MSRLHVLTIHLRNGLFEICKKYAGRYKNADIVALTLLSMIRQSLLVASLSNVSILSANFT